MGNAYNKEEYVEEQYEVVENVDNIDNKTKYVETTKVINKKKKMNLNKIKMFLYDEWYLLSYHGPRDSKLSCYSYPLKTSGKILTFGQESGGYIPFELTCIKLDGYKLDSTSTINGKIEILSSKEFVILIGDDQPKTFHLLDYDEPYSVISSVDKSISWIATRKDFTISTQQYGKFYKKWAVPLSLDENYDITSYELFDLKSSDQDLVYV